MPELPALSITGARAIGKTVTASRRAGTIFRIDDPGHRQLLDADPTLLETSTPPVLIDEWQLKPETWDFVRRAVDTDRRAGRFLLTGSAAPVKWRVHSGAGRIVNIRMRPLSLSERRVAIPTVSLSALLDGNPGPIRGSTTFRLEDYAREIVRSGFPGLRGSTDRVNTSELEAYVDHVIDQDFRLGSGYQVRNPTRLRRWLAAYAAATSTTASLQTIRDAATDSFGQTPAKRTAELYDDALQRLWLVDPVAAWLPTANRLRRLSQPRKHHLVDPALAARLLNATVESLLEARPIGFAIPREGALVGALFESLVTLEVRTAAQAAGARVYHLRTKAGEREIDLIVERRDGRVLAIEVKLGRTADDGDVRHLNWLEREIGPNLLDRMVVTTGSDAYRRPDGVAVVPAALLGP